MGAKTGYMLLGSGIICLGLTLLLPTNSGSTSSAGSQMGLSCLSGLLGLAGLGLVVAGNIVIFVKRNELSKGGKRGAIAGLIGAISMGVLFLITIIMVFFMAASIISSAASSGIESDYSAALDDMLSWVLIIGVVSVLSAIAQVLAEGGPSFWSEKKPAQLLGIIGGSLVIILTIVNVILLMSVIDDVRNAYGDIDFEDEESVEEMQGALDPGKLYAVRAVTSVGHFLMAAAAFMIGTTIEGPQKGYGNMSYPDYSMPPSY